MVVLAERFGRPAPSCTASGATTSTRLSATVAGRPARPGKAELPSGTVTFLFTDMEGSTRLLTRLGSGYAEVLGEHQRLLRAAFDAYDGREVNTNGDAFFVAFTRAGDAIAAAVAGAAGARFAALARERGRAGPHGRPHRRGRDRAG
jgi:class 3 adenylate cyclase